MESDMPVKNDTPYKYKENKHFWRTGVADVKLGHELVQSLHDIAIEQEDVKIASIGSCFAQHVGHWLISNNYPFSQSKLDAARTSSFAFGNIYTPKCFLQWLNHDAKVCHRFDIYHCQKTGNYFDLLRPTLNEAGFISKEELLSQRENAKSELYETLRTCNVLIFTLGLTEAWKDIDHVFYPSCPGVIAGEFDDELYSFHEFHYDEILSDITAIKAKLKAINPDLKVILTVSPVPLTATATNKHILVANQYSKAVLRSVAGYLSSTDDCFQYFPSYELITVNNENDFRFEGNRRTVSMDGVNYVMQHFNHAFADNAKVTSKAAPKVMLANSSPAIAHEAECEEERLEAIKKLKKNVNTNQTKMLTLIGDSHMGKLSSAFTDLGIAHCGGMIMNGSGFAQKRFFSCPDEYMVPLESAESRTLWAPALKNIKLHEEQNFQKLSVIISNIGLQTHQNVGRMVQSLRRKGLHDISALSTEQYVDFFQEDQLEQLSILINLRDAGHNVIVISDTPFCQYFEHSKAMKPLIYAYHAALELTLSNVDIPFLNVAHIFDEEIEQPSSYMSNFVDENGLNDWYHGNENYYRWIAKKLVYEVLMPVMQPQDEL